jgi:hypothetical protein
VGVEYRAYDEGDVESSRNKGGLEDSSVTPLAIGRCVVRAELAPLTAAAGFPGFQQLEAKPHAEVADTRHFPNLRIIAQPMPLESQSDQPELPGFCSPAREAPRPRVRGCRQATRTRHAKLAGASYCGI